MFKSVEMILHPRQSAANDRYADWTAREERALEKVGNPPDCTDRDWLIGELAGEWPEESGAMPHEVPDDWTFTQWASEHDYTARQIQQVNLAFPYDEREEAVWDMVQEEERADWWPTQDPPQWDSERDQLPKEPEADQAQRQA